MGYLKFEQRIRIKELLDLDTPVSSIAKEIGTCRETIYNELRRGTDANGKYNPIFSEQQFQLRQLSKGRSAILQKHPELAAYISKLILERQYSPKRIVKLLGADTSDEKMLLSSVNTIYQAIDNGLIPGVTRETLQFQKDKTKMFSGGMVCIPKRIRESLNLCDGDVFSVDFQDDGSVILRKQEE